MNHQSNAGITFYTLLGLAVIWAISYPLATLSRGTQATLFNSPKSTSCHVTQCNPPPTHGTNSAAHAK